jgi:hypothetical protein
VEETIAPVLDPLKGVTAPSIADPATIPLNVGMVIPAADGLTNLESDTELAWSVTDLTMHHTQDIMIKDMIDELADKLAAFCFEHLEEDLSSRDGDNVTGNINQEAFEEELQVWDSKAIIW